MSLWKWNEQELAGDELGVLAVQIPKPLCSTVMDRRVEKAWSTWFVGAEDRAGVCGQGLSLVMDIEVRWSSLQTPRGGMVNTTETPFLLWDL